MELFPVTLLPPKILRLFLYFWQIGASLPIRYCIAITGDSLSKNQEAINNIHTYSYLATIFIPIYILLGSTVEIILPTQISGKCQLHCVTLYPSCNRLISGKEWEDEVSILVTSRVYEKSWEKWVSLSLTVKVVFACGRLVMNCRSFSPPLSPSDCD